MTAGQKRKMWIKTIIRVATVLVLIATAAVLWQNRPAQPAPLVTHEFFTDDDGQTWFTDAGSKVAPFDHNGRSAVLARVYQCKSGQRFVGYLVKFTDQAKADITQSQTTHKRADGVVAATQPESNGLLFKKPHAKEWVADNDPKVKEVKKVVGPDGSVDCELIRP